MILQTIVTYMNTSPSHLRGGVKMVWILEGKLASGSNQWIFLNVTTTRAIAREWAVDYREAGFAVRMTRRMVWDV